MKTYRHQIGKKIYGDLHKYFSMEHFDLKNQISS